MARDDRPRFPASASPTACSIATSPPPGRTAAGSPTSPTCAPGRVAVPRRRAGPLLQDDRRLEPGRPHAHRARHGRAADGADQAPAGPRADLAFRPGQPVRQPGLRPAGARPQASRNRWAAAATATTTPSPRASSRRSRRSSSTAAAGRPEPSCGPRSSIHRGLLQPATPPQDPRSTVAGGLRERNSRARRCESRRFAARVPKQDEDHDNNRECHCLVKPCPPKRGNSTVVILRDRPVVGQ